MAKTAEQKEKGNILEATLKHTKDTKGTFRFEDEKAGITFYLPKRFIEGDEAPETITLTIS